jgi:hypothetical protein
MRITISHNQPKAEVVQSVDRSFDKLFQGVPKFPVRLVLERLRLSYLWLQRDLLSQRSDLSSRRVRKYRPAPIGALQ